MKIDTEFKVDICDLIAIIYEIDLFHKWVPFNHSAETVSWLFLTYQIKKVSRTQKAAIIR